MKKEKMVGDYDQITCAICGVKFKVVNHLHLRTHNISVGEYRDLFPDARFYSDEIRVKLGPKEGYVAWNRDLTKETDPRMAKQAKTLTGRKLSEEHKENISKYLQETGVWNKGLTKEVHPSILKGALKQAISLEKRYELGEISPWNKGLTKEDDERIRDYGKKEARAKKGIVPQCAGWNKGLTKETSSGIATFARKMRSITPGFWRDPEYVAKIQKSRQMRPNKAELTLEGLIQDLDLPFEYVGDLSVIIDGLCPDFICVERGLLLELYGCWWHGCREHWPDEVDRYEHSRERVRRLEFKGYKVLVIWEHELGDKVKLADRLRLFAEGGLDG